MTNMLWEQKRRQDRCDRERRDQRTRQRVRVSSRHRAEDLTFDALHSEQRKKRRQRNGGREQNRPIHLEGTREDHLNPRDPSLGLRRWQITRQEVMLLLLIRL